MKQTIGVFHPRNHHMSRTMVKEEQEQKIVEERRAVGNSADGYNDNKRKSQVSFYEEMTAEAADEEPDELVLPKPRPSEKF